MATSYTSTQILSSNIKIYCQFRTITYLLKTGMCWLLWPTWQGEDIQESKNIFPNGGSHSRGCRPGVLQVST